jgi:23S rRNA (uracil1939-C5)-methyltransferase
MSDSAELEGQTVRVERCVPGGDGLARARDGRIVFVPGGFPGDIIKLDRVKLHSGFARALQWNLHEPSRDRRTTPCPIADRCGGCDWMQLDERAQAEAKLDLVRDALSRVGGFADLPQPLELVSASGLAYRSRLRLSVGIEGGLGLRARKSHEHVAVGSCAVATKELNAALNDLQPFFAPGAYLTSTSPPADTVRKACECIEQVELRVLAARPEALLYPRKHPGSATDAPPPEWLEALSRRFVVQTANAPASARQSVQLRFSVHDGDVRRDELVSLQVTPAAFTQVNWDINQAIVGELVEGAQRRKLRKFLDLYCGVGNFSLPLLREGLVGCGVENNSMAVKCARAAADQQQLGGSFAAKDAARLVRKLRKQHATFDLVVADPPRSGIKPLLDDVAAVASGWVFYCACDPVSLARDARGLVARGFELQELRAYDMFPQTHHVELTAWLRKA